MPPQIKERIKNQLLSFLNCGSERRNKEKIRPAKIGLKITIKRPTINIFCLDFSKTFSSIENESRRNKRNLISLRWIRKNRYVLIRLHDYFDYRVYFVLLYFINNVINFNWLVNFHANVIARLGGFNSLMFNLH